MREQGSPPALAVVAGHVCVDVIPTLSDAEGSTELSVIMRPGRLTKVGPIVASTGGAVSNTGLALYRLGVPVKLMGKLGGDLFGRAAIDLFNRIDPSLGAGLIVAEDEPASYTIVISPPGVDRVFLHCPGPNDTFTAADLPADAVAGARVFHFGYPPIMRRMYLDGGSELERLLSGVRATGVTVSLDMAQPDPNSEAGQVDWQAILRRCLPYVDVFGANIEEISFMLERSAFESLRAGAQPTPALLRRLGARLVEMGAAVVLIKLGSHGLYLRTSRDAARVAAMGALSPSDGSWVGREMISPCMVANVVGTTGAGDSTHAGFLAALIRGEAFEAAATSAVAVGACSVEGPDATSGIPAWERVHARLMAGWQRQPHRLDLADWRGVGGLWASPGDLL